MSVTHQDRKVHHNSGNTQFNTKAYFLVVDTVVLLNAESFDTQIILIICFYFFIRVLSYTNGKLLTLVKSKPRASEKPILDCGETRRQQYTRSNSPGMLVSLVSFERLPRIRISSPHSPTRTTLFPQVGCCIRHNFFRIQSRGPNVLGAHRNT